MTLWRVQYGIVNYRHDVVQPISRIYSPCITETLYLLNRNSSCPPSPSPRQPPFSSLLLWVWLFWIPHISGILQHLSLCDGIISLSFMSSMFNHVVTYGRIFFFFKPEYYSIATIYHVFFMLNSLLILACWANMEESRDLIAWIWDPNQSGFTSLLAIYYFKNLGEVI